MNASNIMEKEIGGGKQGLEEFSLENHLLKGSRLAGQTLSNAKLALLLRNVSKLQSEMLNTAEPKKSHML